MIIPRDFFPHMPDEVFDMWLEPIAEHYGWPFQSASDITEGTKWFKVLGEINLNFWVNAKWIKTEIDLEKSKALLSKGTKFRLISIGERCVDGFHTLVASVIGSEERFRACADFIRDNKCIPKPIVVLMRNGGIEIVDGNHRVAALIHVGIPPGYKIPAWITEIKTE